MKTWTKQSNGHVLTITMDEERVIGDFQCSLDNFRKELARNPEGVKEFQYEEAEPYYREKVGSFEVAMSMEDCIAALEEAVETLRKIADETDPEAVFNEMVLKKNGTFKRTVKPVLVMLPFGPYWEDSYGWRIKGVRIEASDDTHAEILIKNWTQHY